jgi:hypothetical protein
MEKLAMSTWSSVPISLLAWAIFLAFSSRSDSFQSMPADVPPLGPQIAPLPANVHLDAKTILEQAYISVANLDWLALDVRQAKRRGETPWSSEGSLQRGPNHCCRLEVAMRTGSSEPSRIVVVSDGKVLARVTPSVGAKPKIESVKMPEQPTMRTDLLAIYGCGGPATILGQAHARGSDWSAQPALLGERPCLALTCRLTTTDTSESKNIRLFVDAETLWLTRAEWWSEHPEHGGSLLYEIEFLQPRINQPLTMEECERVFSYRPES